MVVKYGKGYAMDHTTLLTIDFTEGAKPPTELAQKRKQESMAEKFSGTQSFVSPYLFSNFFLLYNTWKI